MTIWFIFENLGMILTRISFIKKKLPVLNQQKTTKEQSREEQQPESLSKKNAHEHFWNKYRLLLLSKMSGFKYKRVRPQQGIGAPFSSLEGSKFGADTIFKMQKQGKSCGGHWNGRLSILSKANKAVVNLKFCAPQSTQM
jgi:hypothetical protein